MTVIRTHSDWWYNGKSVLTVTVEDDMQFVGWLQFTGCLLQFTLVGVRLHRASADRLAECTGAVGWAHAFAGYAMSSV